MKVLLDLGTAFSTTFVALILSGLVVIPLNMMLCAVEDRVLLRASRTTGGIDDPRDREGRSGGRDPQESGVLGAQAVQDESSTEKTSKPQRQRRNTSEASAGRNSKSKEGRGSIQ